MGSAACHRLCATRCAAQQWAVIGALGVSRRRRDSRWGQERKSLHVWYVSLVPEFRVVGRFLMIFPFGFLISPEPFDMCHGYRV